MANRRERLREQTYQEIITTARQQIAQRGAAALSLRAIAREMGMTAPALYRYFENRDALVTALIVIAYQSLRDHLEDTRQENAGQDYITQLTAVGIAYREWALAHAEDYALIFGTPIPEYKAPEQATLPIARSSLGVLIRILQEGWEAGEFILPEDPPALASVLLAVQPDFRASAPVPVTAIALWSLVHGLVSLELFNHFAVLLQDPAELFEMQLENQLKILTGRS